MTKMAPSRADPVKCNDLYDFCALQPIGTVFYEEDLGKASITHDRTELVAICQELADSQLFDVNTHDGIACYKLRKREDAKKYVQ